MSDIGSIEFNKIYNEECVTGMKKLPTKSVNCIVTSPPYNLGGDFHTFVSGKRVTYGDYNTYKDKVSEEDYQKCQVNVLDECFRVLKDDGVMFYNHKNRIVNGSVIFPTEWINKSKFNICQVITLNLKSTANVDKRRFFPVHELLFVLTKSNKIKLNNMECFTDVWEMKKVSRKESGHPATFHVELPRRCIVASTKEDDTILDPYMGSGTTAVASKMLHRNYLGYEIDKDYIVISDERLGAIKDEVIVQESMF